jgi:hypothetical protein
MLRRHFYLKWVLFRLIGRRNGAKGVAKIAYTSASTHFLAAVVVVVVAISLFFLCLLSLSRNEASLCTKLMPTLRNTHYIMRLLTFTNTGPGAHLRSLALTCAHSRSLALTLTVALKRARSRVTDTHAHTHMRLTIIDRWSRTSHLLRFLSAPSPTIFITLENRWNEEQ